MNLTKIGDEFLLESPKIEDGRGYLEVFYDAGLMKAHGLNIDWPSQIESVTRGCGVVRGMHWQAGQIKLVRCLSGLVMDVTVDIRPGSPNFGVPVALELSEENRMARYIPAGFAHGFQCVSECCTMLYSLSAGYDRRAARSFYCEDDAVGIKWPLPVMKLSDQDASAPLLADALRRH